MNIFKKWKELKEELIRESNIDNVLNLTFNYKQTEIKEPIVIDNIYIVKHYDDLIFFVRKDTWKKYIGANRDWLEDSIGNDFPHDNLYKTSDLKNIKSCHEFDIPKEMIKEMFDKLIEHVDDLKNILENKKKEEFYK